jgi:tRNA 2-thiouridine synthesizing protein A
MGGGVEETMSDITIDTKGMRCPLPVLKARKAMKDLAPGATMMVLATDPGAVKDFEHFCRVTGATLLDCREDAEGVFAFTLQKPA